MKRMHIHVGVDEIAESVTFYSALFGAQPSKVMSDYAKWMLDDPKVNFAISTRSNKTGIDHLGIQVEDESELDEIRDRIRQTDIAMVDEGETVCCYAESDKSWLQDPAGIAWEAYQTMGDAQLFSDKTTSEKSACCTPVSIPVVATDNGTCEPSDNNSGCC
ncbi:ArsI/CadI family heavy metal resistance metalloenzyme [Methylophaga sp.]|uniref:ArsI/CadI family heavy metal resistance metalloenzyme n=1 Tax=Methylophaga sp. TaxID=2024840 RepID=UPI003F696131